MSSMRLDQVLVSRGLVRSRAQAKEVLDAGQVCIDGRTERKASTKVGEAQDVTLTAEIDHHVGRAAHKLLAALAAFPTFAAAVPGCSAIDVGASTGGFTQVLLERGAERIVALDVGHGQLAPALRDDRRVRNLEGVNVRDVVVADQIEGSPFPVVVSDLSFISLTLALPHMAFLLAPEGHLVALIKPQFEVGRERLGRTGVVTSTQQRRESVEKVLAAARSVGLEPHGLAWSPMVGTRGNHEYLVHLRRADRPAALDSQEVEARLAELLQKEAA